MSDRLLDELRQFDDGDPAPPDANPYDDGSPYLRPDEQAPRQAEFVIDAKTGTIRQAGSDPGSGAFIADFKQRAERSLFVFAKGVLGLDLLTPTLHLDVCRFLQKNPPKRKLALLPRDHLKTSIVSRALPIHILIQPADGNIYFKAKEGASTRILLATEAVHHAENQLGWITARFETCELLRALWPNRVWDNPRRQSRKWNAQAIMLPRTTDYPEASIETFGVGGAVTGRHYDVLLKDDLIAFEAANSPAVMQTAIQWHIASRALMHNPSESLEFIIGTRWAVHDLYDEIMAKDPTVELYIRRVIEDGKPIFPEIFTPEVIEQKRREFGVLFPLLYMNSAADPELTDFDVSQLRRFTIDHTGLVRYDEDERDAFIEDRQKPRAAEGTDETKTDDSMRGVRLTPDTQYHLLGRREYLKHKYPERTPYDHTTSPL